MVTELIGLISNEAVLFEEFLELMAREQVMLSKNDVDGQKRIKTKRRSKVMKSQLLGRQREELISIIKSTNAIEGDQNITHLIELVDQEQGGQLVQFRNIMNNLNSEITEVRGQNELLLKRSREFMSRTIELLERINNPVNNYFQNRTPVKIENN